MSDKPSQSCCKPLVYYILAGVFGVLAIVGFSFSIVVKVPVYNSFITGVDTARFIENTYEVEDCENLVMGDSTCSGLNYQAWLMTSDEARNMCLSDDTPATGPLASMAGWCNSETDAGCVKPDVCQHGMANNFYVFNVTNPGAVIQGAKPVIQELTPVHLAQTFVRHEESVDTELWDTKGIAHWNESNDFVFYGEDESDRMNEKVYLPNLGILSSLKVGKMELNLMELFQQLSAFGTYTIFSKGVVAGIKSNDLILGTVEAFFETPENAMKKQFFSGKFTRSTVLSLPTGIRNELSWQPFGPFLADATGVEGIEQMVPPTDMGIDFFSYKFGCPAKQDRENSGACKFDKKSDDDKALEAEINAIFSEESQDAIFAFIMALDPTDISKAIKTIPDLIESLTPEEGQELIAYMRYAGSYAVNSYAPLRDVLFQGLTNKASDKYDPDYEFYPRFIRTSIAEVIGFKGAAFKDKILGQDISFSIAAPVENYPPTEQYRSKEKNGDDGLYYFKMYGGETQNCNFDRDCMNQAQYKKDGTCTADATCTPNVAAGFDVKFVPGTLLGEGNDSYHHVGAITNLFVGQIFSAAQLTQVENNADFSGAQVDKWELSDIAFRNENCDGSNKDDSIGLDCTSPYLTFDLGYFASPMPSMMKVPVLASLPHFFVVEGSSSIKTNYYPNDGRIQILGCEGAKECEGERNFKIEVWTEPISGALVHGSQKLQMNIRVPPTANVATGGLTEEALYPSVWLDKYQTAYEFQLAQVRFLQSAPGMFDMFMWICIGFGFLMLVCAGVLLFFGLKKRKDLAAELAVTKTHVVMA